MASGSERRKSKRFGANLFLEMYRGTLNENLGRGVVVDVSLSGMAVDTEADLKDNESIECHVEIPLTIKAKVVRRIIPGHMKRYGLKFMGQGFFDKMVLRKFLKGQRETRKI